MDTKDLKAKLIFAAFELVMGIISYIIFVCIDNNPLAGMLFILPCLKENLQAITVERGEISKKMRLMNLIVFIISVISIAVFTLSALGIINGSVAAAFLMLVVPIRYSFYLAFYYRALDIEESNDDNE